MLVVALSMGRNKEGAMPDMVPPFTNVVHCIEPRVLLSGTSNTTFTHEHLTLKGITNAHAEDTLSTKSLLSSRTKKQTALN